MTYSQDGDGLWVVRDARGGYVGTFVNAGMAAAWIKRSEG